MKKAVFVFATDIKGATHRNRFDSFAEGLFWVNENNYTIKRIRTIDVYVHDRADKKSS